MCLFTILVFQSGFTQFSEDFSQPLSNWGGDLNDFIITPSSQLQLNASDAGTSQLYRSIEFFDSMVFELFISLDFPPSNNNRFRWNLLSSTEFLDDGYFIQIGENGNDDALIFGFQNESIMAGEIGKVANNPTLFIRIHYYNNRDWKIFADYTGNRNLDLIMELSHEAFELVGPYYHGITCFYTSSRKEGFIFDNWQVNKFLPDRVPPQILNTKVINNQEIVVTFNEPLSPIIPAKENFSITPGNIHPEEILLEGNVLNLYFNNLPDEELFTLLIDQASDLSGNIGNSYQIQNLMVLTAPSKGSLFLSEILFNPKGEGSDYLEIFNGSKKFIELKGLEIYNQKNNQSEIFKDSFVLYPSEHLAISENALETELSFSPPDTALIWENSLPSFNNESGNVSILWNNEIIESFDYSENLHSPIISNTDGVSLERIQFSSSSQSASNWTSSAATVNYGTPGYKNTASIESIKDDFGISLRFQNFSPNNDGFRDRLIIDYRFEKSNYILNAKVYTENGKVVSEIANNETLSTEGVILWDGTNQKSESTTVGIYIIYIEVFHTDGETYQYKFACTLSKDL